MSVVIRTGSNPRLAALWSKLQGDLRKEAGVLDLCRSSTCEDLLRVSREIKLGNAALREIGVVTTFLRAVIEEYGHDVQAHVSSPYHIRINVEALDKGDPRFKADILAGWETYESYKDGDDDSH